MGEELLTIVVSTYNRVERLKQCLENLVLQVSSLESPSSVSILVVNNASTDGTAQFLQDLTNPSLKVLNNSANRLNISVRITFRPSDVSCK